MLMGLMNDLKFPLIFTVMVLPNVKCRIVRAGARNRPASVRCLLSYAEW
jgi:hypothetical protein